MPSNRTRINADLVQKTQYNVPPNQIAKNPCPKSQPLPKFKPLHIDDLDDHGSPNLPSNLDTHDPLKLFGLFFTNKIMDKLVEWTNTHAEFYPPDKEKEYLRAW
jgi:hypothetical protein